MRLASAVFCFLLVVLAAAPPRVEAATLLFDYVGYDYESPNPDVSQFGELGSGYVSIGEVPGLFGPLVADLATNTYTYHFSGLTSIARDVFGDFVVVTYSGGTLSIYEDPTLGGTAPDYGANPPNGTAPGTFTDGTLFLTGTLQNFQIVFNTASQSGSYEGQFTATGGSQIGNIPVNQRDGWTFAGATSNSLDVPPGYAHQVDGQTFLDEPVHSQPSSWGRIKAIYR
jgi:hypothetical protein